MKTYAKLFRNLSIILFLILSAEPAYAEFRHFDEWTPAERRLFLAYNTAAYIDHRQTRVGLRNGYTEANKWLYGPSAHRDKSIAINLLISGGMYWAIGHYEPDETNTVTLGLTMGRVGAIIHNDSIGVSWKVAF
jgi:hypothetical protein